MHAEELDLPELELAVDDPELILEDLPSIEEVLRTSPVTISPPLKINQTPFTERICIRINRSVLATLKQQAADKGERYQTFINLLLAQQVATYAPPQESIS